MRDGVRDVLKMTISWNQTLIFTHRILHGNTFTVHGPGYIMRDREKDQCMPTDIQGLCSRSALLVIDMQNDFVRPGAPLEVAGVRSIIPKVSALLTYFREKGLPVFHVIRVHRASGVDVEITRREIFSKTPFAVEGTPGAEVIPELAPTAGEHVVKKTRMSAFFQTDLDLMLRTLGVNTLFIAGIQTPNCVRTTVFDAMAYNYRVFVVRDAIAAKTDAIHEANMTDMQNIGINIVECAEVPRMLR